MCIYIYIIYYHFIIFLPFPQDLGLCKHAARHFSEGLGKEGRDQRPASRLGILELQSHIPTSSFGRWIQTDSLQLLRSNLLSPLLCMPQQLPANSRVSGLGLHGGMPQAGHPPAPPPAAGTKTCPDTQHTQQVASGAFYHDDR